MFYALIKILRDTPKNQVSNDSDIGRPSHRRFLLAQKPQTPQTNGQIGGKQMGRRAFSVLKKGRPGQKRAAELTLRYGLRAMEYEIRFTLHAIRSFIASPNPYPCKLFSDKALGLDRL